MSPQGANLSEAFRRVTSRPWLLAALALTNIGLALLLSSPLSAMLSELLDLRPAASAMLQNGDDGLAVELLTDHPELNLGAAAAAASGALLYGLFSWILSGGVLAALVLDGERRARGAHQVLAASAQRAGRMITLGLFGVRLRLIPLVIGGVGMMLMRAIVKGRSFPQSSLTVMITLVIAGVAWSAVSVAIDYARGLSLDDPQTRSWRLLARGLKLALTRRTATLQLIAFSMAAWLAVGVLYFTLANHIPVLFVLTLLRLLAVVARAAITATTLTAAARVAVAK